MGLEAVCFHQSKTRCPNLMNLPRHSRLIHCRLPLQGLQNDGNRKGMEDLWRSKFEPKPSSRSVSVRSVRFHHCKLSSMPSHGRHDKTSKISKTLNFSKIERQLQMLQGISSCRTPTCRTQAFPGDHWEVCTITGQRPQVMGFYPGSS